MAHMITDDTMLQTLVDGLLAAGVPEDRAEEYAALIGDTPEVEGDEVLIRDEAGVVLARVPSSVLS